MTRTQKRTHSVRLDDEDLHELTQISMEEGRSISDLIREGVRSYLEIRSHRKMVLEVSPDTLENLGWLVEMGYFRDLQGALDSATDHYIDAKQIQQVERIERRRKLEEWARKERRLQL